MSLQAHQKAPCLFEFVYLARPDSVLDGASVYECRINMGTKLAAKIKREWSHVPIDVVVPIPFDEPRGRAGNCDAPKPAVIATRSCATGTWVRTFIMPGQALRKQSIRRKLNPIPQGFQR